MVVKACVLVKKEGESRLPVLSQLAGNSAGVSSQLRDTTYLGPGSNGFSSGSSTPSFVSYDLGYFALETQIKPSWSLVDGLGRLVDVRRTFQGPALRAGACWIFKQPRVSARNGINFTAQLQGANEESLYTHLAFGFLCSYCGAHIRISCLVGEIQ